MCTGLVAAHLEYVLSRSSWCQSTHHATWMLTLSQPPSPPTAPPSHQRVAEYHYASVSKLYTSLKIQLFFKGQKNAAPKVKVRPGLWDSKSSRSERTEKKGVKISRGQTEQDWNECQLEFPLWPFPEFVLLLIVEELADICLNKASLLRKRGVKSVAFCCGAPRRPEQAVSK